MEHLNAYLKAKRGRLSRLAEELDITPGAIAQWKEVPDDKLIAIETATGIPRQLLRPDLYEGMKRVPKVREAFL
jgi:DNA-binding transcriptional regulator YdaS (Cro superfamily)